MKRALAISAVLLALTISVNAFDVNLTGTEITVHYTEPTRDADGTPLNDLRQTEIWYQLEGSTVPAMVKGVAATALSGGGTITTQIILPVNTGDEKNFLVWAAARDISGNISTGTAKIPVRIDRMPPAAPQ
jgi:hypothetical protein